MTIDDLMLPISYCLQVSPGTYESQREQKLNDALSQLLDQIVNDQKLNPKDKKKKLKQGVPEVAHHICGRRKSATDEKTSTMVLTNFARSPVKSVMKISQELTISKSSVHRIFKTQKFHQYKVHLVQAIHGDDTDSDEAIFHLNGQVNRHNMRYWSEVNPNWHEEGHHQTNPMIMVWAGIWEEEIVGPWFFNTSNVIGETYLELLQTFLFEYLDNIPIIRRRNLLFQQDGAPPHFAICVRDYLNQSFPERWIGRRSPVEWPPRSPNLTPLDYFLWGHLKFVVYQNRPRTLDDLKDAIITGCQKITTETLIRERESMHVFKLKVNNLSIYCDFD
ncbi:hypothetical protein QYM36_001664 [Artemia franciscana]|uniref:Transposase n=1 Tax=Artemia franciscana TaxID=6661 RepID=A0AA88IEM5_ARTSF|nr:hypothetical protein QYM36_001664 [Artemia franciscana]